jgi:hypothetical protein
LLVKPSFSLHLRRLDTLWILLLIILLMTIILGWPNPASGAFHPQAATPLPLPTSTPIPAEYLETADQTNGIVCGSVVLVMIIVGGTLGVLRRKNSKNQS